MGQVAWLEEIRQLVDEAVLAGAPAPDVIGHVVASARSMRNGALEIRDLLSRQGGKETPQT